MAALSGITAVRPTTNTIAERVTLGATSSVGQPLYEDVTVAKHKLAGNASTTLAKCSGITITPGVDTSESYIAKGGSIELVGTTMVVGATYYVGNTPGEIVPESDLSTGHIVTRLGTASAATVLDLSIKATEIAHA